MTNDETAQRDRDARRRRGKKVLDALPDDIRQYVMRRALNRLNWHADAALPAQNATADLIGRWVDSLDGPAFWRIITQGEESGRGA